MDLSGVFFVLSCLVLAFCFHCKEEPSTGRNTDSGPERSCHFLSSLILTVYFGRALEGLAFQS